jgi:hypothetical protein
MSAIWIHAHRELLPRRETAAVTRACPAKVGPGFAKKEMLKLK